MNKHTFEATPLAQIVSTSDDAATQWFAVHYTADAAASLPRAVFASAVQLIGNGDVLQFLVAPDGQPPYVVLEVPTQQVERCTPYADLRSALADAFAAEASNAA
ncbi:MAG: hypothetical protein NVSMB48_09180 [Marmoricola sp.]